MALAVRYLNDTTGKGPSNIIWGNCPWLAARENSNIGFGHENDFIGTPDALGGTTETGMEYDFYGDTGVIISGNEVDADGGGHLDVSGNDADNDECVISTMSPAFVVSDTASNAHRLWFEAKVKLSTVDNNELGMFVGLAYDFGSSVTVAKTLCLTNDDMDLGAFSFLGFHVDAANGDAIDFVYKAEAQSAVVVIAEVVVPVLDTYNKLGFTFDPSFPTTKRIKIFVDSVEQTTYVTGTNIAAATFPDAEPMGMVYCVKNGDGGNTEHKAQMDWWRGFQER